MCSRTHLFVRRIKLPSESYVGPAPDRQHPGVSPDLDRLHRQARLLIGAQEAVHWCEYWWNFPTVLIAH